MNGQPIDLNAILTNRANILIDSLRKNLQKHGVKSSSNLIAEMRFDINIFGEGFSMKVFMPDYWKYVDKGVRGTQDERGGNSPFQFKSNKKFINPIGLMGEEGWISRIGIPIREMVKKKKGLSGKGANKAVIDANKQFAWAAAFNIHKKGLRPTNFVKDALDKEFIDGLKKDIGSDLAKKMKIELIEFKS